MFTTTAEIRWFFRGSLPPSTPGLAYADWSQVDRRTDEYLPLAPSECVGVKFRDGTFDIKARQGVGEETKLSAGAVGMMEIWCKWSLQAPAPELHAAISRSNDLLAVEKRRWTLICAADAAGGLTILDSRVRDCCAVEVTALVSAWQTWWTFGFEATGTPGSEVANLLTVANAFLGRHDLPEPLTAGDSYAYPAWLGRLIDPPTLNARQSTITAR
jgi:hypothetical protein